MDKDTVNKAGRIIAIVLASIFLLACLLQLVLLVWGGDIIRSKIEKEIEKGSDKLYSFKAEKIVPSLFGRSVTFKNAHFAPNPDVYKSLKEKNEADRRLYNVNVKRLKLKGIHLSKLFFDDEVEINNFFLENPDIIIIDHPDVKKKEDEKAKFTLYELFSPKYSSVTLGDLTIQKGTFNLIEAGKDSLLKIHITGLDSELKDILVDSSNGKNNVKLFEAGSFDYRLDSINIAIDNGMNDLSCGEIRYSSGEKNLMIKNIKLKPKAGKFEYAQSFGHEKDRLNLSVSEIVASDFSSVEFLQSGVLNIGRLVLNNFDMDAFRDKRLKLADKIKKLPQEMLREISLPIKIDTLELNGNKISYSEYHAEGKEGLIYFTNINGIISNITNIKTDSIGNHMKVKARGYIYGKSRLDADFDFHIFDENNLFYYSGYLNKIDATAFNQMSVPVADLEIEEAIINDMEFHASANTNVATGTMTLKYDNLKVEIVNKELKSFLANTFVIKNSNPQDDELREGKMYFERDKRKAITNYVWKSILSGMKSSIGMDKHLPESKDE